MYFLALILESNAEEPCLIVEHKCRQILRKYKYGCIKNMVIKISDFPIFFFGQGFARQYLFHGTLIMYLGSVSAGLSSLIEPQVKGFNYRYSKKKSIKT